MAFSNKPGLPVIIDDLPTVYQTLLRNQPIDLRFLTFPSILSGGAPKKSVVFLRAAYEHEMLTNKCLVAVRAERVLREAGCTIVNPVLSILRAHRKDVIYESLRMGGVSVPWFLPNPTLQEILVFVESGELSYPFVYRIADGTGGAGMVLVKDIQELESAHKKFEERAFSPYKRTIVVPFIKSMKENLYFKIRTYVLGGKMDMAIQILYNRWVGSVRYSSNPVEVEGAIADFGITEAIKSDSVKVGKILGLEIYAVDILRDETGKHYVIDVNPTYNFSPKWDFLPEKLRIQFSSHPERVARHLYALANLPLPEKP